MPVTGGSPAGMRATVTPRACPVVRSGCQMPDIGHAYIIRFFMPSIKASAYGRPTIFLQSMNILQSPQ